MDDIEHAREEWGRAVRRCMTATRADFESLKRDMMRHRAAYFAAIGRPAPAVFAAPDDDYRLKVWMRNV